MKRVKLFIISILTISSLYAQKDSINWHLYTNASHKFSISYPDFCYEIDTSGPVSLDLKQRYHEYNNLSFWLDKTLYSVYFGNRSVPIFYVYIFDNKDNIDLKTFIFKIINQSPGFYKKEELTYSNVILDNHKAQKVIYQNKAGGYDGINKDVFIKKGKLIYAIMIVNPPEGDYDIFLNKILTSFKFLN